jgi:hypothetical protein
MKRSALKWGAVIGHDAGGSHEKLDIFLFTLAD